MAATCRYLNEAVNSYFGHLSRVGKLEEHLLTYFQHCNYSNAEDEVEEKVHNKFITGDYSPLWLYNCGISRKGMRRQPINEVVLFPGDSSYPVKNRLLQRNIVKLVTIYGFTIEEIFQDVQPGRYEFNFCVKVELGVGRASSNCSSKKEQSLSLLDRWQMKHETKLKLTWKTSSGSIPTTNPSTSQNIDCEELSLKPDDWDRYSLNNDSGWFRFTMKPIHIEELTDIRFEMDYDSTYSLNIIYLDFLELRKLSF